MGKSYAKRDPVVKLDLYHTAKCLTELLVENEKFKKIDEPACGQMAIVNPLLRAGYDVNYSDISMGEDFLKASGIKKKKDLVTNPPFYLWDEFVRKSKELQYRKTAFIGKGNYFGTYARYKSGLFNGLKKVYFFNRYVDYRTPLRPDGLFHVGAMQTGWFVWERGYHGKPEIVQLDVQPWAKLGNYDEDYYSILQHLGIELTWTPDMEIDAHSIMDDLQSDLQFCYTMKEEAMIKRGTITEVLKATKSAGFDRSLLNLKKWERV